jgi:hypothetical protein
MYQLIGSKVFCETFSNPLRILTYFFDTNQIKTKKARLFIIHFFAEFLLSFHFLKEGVGGLTWEVTGLPFGFFETDGQN